MHKHDYRDSSKTSNFVQRFILKQIATKPIKKPWFLHQDLFSGSSNLNFTFYVHFLTDADNLSLCTHYFNYFRVEVNDFK